MDTFDALPGVHFRHAGLLDVPYIFTLMTDACMNDGCFSSTMLTGAGYGSLLVMLLSALHVFQGWRRRKDVRHELIVAEVDDEAVGFLHYIRYQTAQGAPQVYIDSCAIAAAHRNHGYGNRMVEWVMDREADGSTLITARCNHYAKAMQHIFKRHRFVRKSVGQGLESYTFGAGAAVTAPPPAPARARPTLHNA